MSEYAQNSFLGGEWAKTMQGRFDRPDYRTALNLCLNGLPIETGAWIRRSGSRFAGTTRSGLQGVIIPFTFEADLPYEMEFTAGHLRFWAGLDLVTTNDSQVVVSISGANPALVTMAADNTWVTGDQVYFTDIGTGTPTLANRCFTWTKLTTKTGTLTDAITGATINGSTLGSLFGTTTINHVLDIATPFTIDQIQVLRSVQANLQTVLLTGGIPQVLTATLPVNAPDFVSFTLAPADFKDGPYLDPFTNGVIANPGGATGNINITLSFPAWDLTRSYDVGDFVSFSSVNYICIKSGIVNFEPDLHPDVWTAVSSQIAIGPNGFQPSDIGRLVRFLSEPPDWVVGGTYTASVSVVKYNNTYWACLTGNTGAVGNAPGTGLTFWGIASTGAKWTWGRIIALVNNISGTAAGIAYIGTLTQNGGLASAFDGTALKNSTSCAAFLHLGNAAGATVIASSGDYAGVNYAGTVATQQQILSATVFPSTDFGFASVSGVSILNGVNVIFNGRSDCSINVTMNLRAKNTPPANSADGTLLGSVIVPWSNPAVTIDSNDTTTNWVYVWIEVSVVGTASFQIGNYGINPIISQVIYQSPIGTGTSGNGCTVQLLGDPLLYNAAIRTWRLGLLSTSSMWPTCGTYHEGRLWISGVVGNRIDGSMSNQLFVFSPTDPAGNVNDNNAISYTFNGPDVNTIFWMLPDSQGIACGTLAGEWLVQASNLNSPLTPTSMQAHRHTTIGCANIEPRRTEHTIVFVQKFLRKIMEYFPDVFSGKFSAPNLALTAKHLTARRIEQIAYQQELAPIIWSRCADGSLLGATYKRESLMSSQGPTFIGWHQHTLGSGRLIESIAAGPSPATATDAAGTLDTLAMVTNDPSTNVYHVEFMSKIFEEGDDGSTAWFLDNAIVPSNTAVVSVGGVTSLQLFGLWHLNGDTVTVSAGGLDCGDYLVTNGTCSVPFGAAGGLFTQDFVNSFTAGIPVVVGFTYTSDAQIVRALSPQDSGTRTGPSLGKLRRNHQIGVLLQGTQGIYFGTSFLRLHIALFRTAGSTPYPQNRLFSGVFRSPITDEDDYDGMVCWRITRPYPATVCAIEPFHQAKDA